MYLLIAYYCVTFSKKFRFGLRLEVLDSVSVGRLPWRWCLSRGEWRHFNEILQLTNQLSGSRIRKVQLRRYQNPPLDTIQSCLHSSLVIVAFLPKMARKFCVHVWHLLFFLIRQLKSGTSPEETHAVLLSVYAFSWKLKIVRGVGGGGRLIFGWIR